MNIIFKLVFFSIALNLALGFMTNVLYIDPVNMAGNQYDANDANDMINAMGKNVTASGLVENKGNALFRILDMITIGWFNKFIGTIDSYMFGAVNFFGKVFSTYMDANAWGFVFGDGGMLKIIIGIGYAIGLFYLWTGRDLVK